MVHQNAHKDWLALCPSLKKVPTRVIARALTVKLGWVLEPLRFGGEKVYTKVVFSSENSSSSIGQKEVWCIPKSLFSREKRRKIHIHQRGFRVFVGDPFAEHWCIDFGLLKISGSFIVFWLRLVCFHLFLGHSHWRTTCYHFPLLLVVPLSCKWLTLDRPHTSRLWWYSPKNTRWHAKGGITKGGIA